MYDTKNMKNKMKIRYLRFLKDICASKGNHQASEKMSHKMGEKIYCIFIVHTVYLYIYPKYKKDS